MNGFKSIDTLNLVVRFPGEVHDLKEFVQPQQFHVQEVLSQFRSQYGEVSAEMCWDWVCRNVDYPLDNRGRPNEYHRLDAYAYRRGYHVGLGWKVQPRVRQEVWDEWFDFPYEILSEQRMTADCDGASILLCSLLEGMGQHAYVAIGGFAGEADPLTHAWVVTDGQVWEVTAPEAGLALEESNDYYLPLGYFNHEEILIDPVVLDILTRMEYIPQLGEVYAPYGFRHDVGSKIRLIQCLYDEVKQCVIC